MDIDINGANLSFADLSEADLRGALLMGGDLTGTRLASANLQGAFLGHAKLVEADLSFADLSFADCSRAILKEANLRETYLHWANLMDADLSQADLTGCTLYATTTWGLILEGTIQHDLCITPKSMPPITADDVAVAQLLLLFRFNPRLLNILGSNTSTMVLILGSFLGERKMVLEGIKTELRQRGYIPVVYDGEKETTQYLRETISMLAHLARFMFVDGTHASRAWEVAGIVVPDLPQVPVQPLLHASTLEGAPLGSFSACPWVLETYYYTEDDTEPSSLKKDVIDPVERRAKR